MFLFASKVCPSKPVVSHISQKTSEIWGTPGFVAELDFVLRGASPGRSTSDGGSDLL
jgi:hypothetical protein